jgi:hypothetical protein
MPGAGVVALARLVATRDLTPETAADVIRHYPGDIERVMTVLYGGCGTQFVLQVMKVLHPPASAAPPVSDVRGASANHAGPADRAGGTAGGLPIASQSDESQDNTGADLEIKAAFIRHSMQDGDDGWDRTVVNMFEQTAPGARIALQRRLDMEKLIARMSDFEASRLGTLGPVTAGNDTLNKKRAAYLKQVIDDYPPQRAEVFVLFVLRSAYDDDAYAILAEAANQRRLSRLMALPAVADHVHARGINTSLFAEPSESASAAARGLGRGAKHFVKDDRPGKYQAQKAELPDEDADILSQMEMAEYQDNLTPKKVIVDAIDQVTFGIPHGMIDIARDTASAIDDAAHGDYEYAGEKLTAAALVLLTHLGVKAWRYARDRLTAGRQARGEERASDAAAGMKGPEGPRQFVIANFNGPISPEEAKLGAIFSLNPEAEAAMGRLISRIGRDGLEKAAALVQADSRAALFVAEHGEAAVYALLDADGNVTSAATRLPSRQLPRGSLNQAAAAVSDTEKVASSPPGANTRPHATELPEPPAHLSVTPSNVDPIVRQLKASGLMTGDMSVFDSTVRNARLGQEGALGELEATWRWVSEGRQVEVLPEAQNEVLSTGAPRTNPDYRVDGILTEVKTRTKKFPEPNPNGKRNREWIKNEIKDANRQIRNSDLDERGQVELQLRGDADMSLAEIERNVRGNFNSNIGKSLQRVAVYREGSMIGEWVRGPDGTVIRTFPPTGAPR